MSLILDALRRAERAREKDLTRRLSDTGAPGLRTRRRSWVPVVAVGLAAAAVVLLVWPRPAPDPAPAIESETRSDVVPPVAIQAATAPHGRGSSLSDIALPETPVETTPQRRRAPMFHELSATQRAAIPAVSVDAHFWSEDPARRFVILDMRRARAGDEARPGLRVIAIDADSVELDWQGTRFRLPAR